MRQKILKEAYFVGLLLSADQRQRRILLQTISKPQLEALIEILYNILHGYGSLPEKDKQHLKRYQSVIRDFVNRRMSYRQRKTLLLKHFNLLYRLLKVVRRYLTIQWIDK